MRWQWFKDGLPVGESIDVELNDGDVYIMSEKAVPIQDVVVNDNSIYPLIQHFFNRAYGAGILSSSEETTYCLSEKATRFDFDLEKIMHLNFRKDVMQECYFIISSYEQLYESIPEINKKMNLLYSKRK